MVQLGCTPYDIILSAIAGVMVFCDILMALSMRLNVPEYAVYRHKFYEADGHDLNFRAAIRRCKCLISVYPNGIGTGTINFPKLTNEKYFEEDDYDDVLGITKGPAHTEATTTENSEKKNKRFARGGVSVAVLRKQFLDDDELRFACDGLVTNKKIVARKSCVESSENRGKALFVQSGLLHNVTSILDFNNDLVTLTVLPEVDF